MTMDILAAKEAGASAVVLGVLATGRSIDARVMARLVRAARPMGVTFHRAFDEVAAPPAALDTLVRLGVGRVLTAGGAPTAYEGRRALGRLVSRASGRIAVMAGGGIGRGSVAAILADSGVREVHVGSAVASTRLRGRGPFRAEGSAVTAAKVASFLRLAGVRG